MDLQGYAIPNWEPTTLPRPPANRRSCGDRTLLAQLWALGLPKNASNGSGMGRRWVLGSPNFLRLTHGEGGERRESLRGLLFPAVRQCFTDSVMTKITR